MSDVIIRTAISEDINALFELEKQFDVDAYSRKIIEDSLSNDHYINVVAEKNNKILGYASTSYMFEEANLLKIITDCNYRNQKIATKIFEYLVGILKSKKVTKIFLEVKADNLVAKKFYEKIGFKKESVRKKYYGDIDAEILWYYIGV